MQKYQTFWPRFWAAFIDSIVLWTVYDICQRFAPSTNQGWLLILIASVSYSGLWLYSTILHARFGQTLGKKLLGIRVLDLDEQHFPSYIRAAFRDIGIIVPLNIELAQEIYYISSGAAHEFTLGFSLSGFLLDFAPLIWVLLELLTMLTNPKNRALHDYFARTVVIRNKRDA